MDSAKKTTDRRERRARRFATLEELFESYDGDVTVGTQLTRACKREEQMRRVMNLVALGETWHTAAQAVDVTHSSVITWRRRYAWMARAAAEMDAQRQRGNADAMLALAAAYADESRARTELIAARRAQLQDPHTPDRQSVRLAEEAAKREVRIRAQTARGAEVWRQQLEQARARYPRLRPGRTNCLGCALLGSRKCTGELACFSVWRECAQWVEAKREQ